MRAVPSGWSWEQVSFAEIQLWGYQSLHFWEDAGKQASLTTGLGVRQRVSEEGAAGKGRSGQASPTFTYQPGSNLLLNVSSWFAGITDRDAFSLRVHAGVTGYF